MIEPSLSINNRSRALLHNRHQSSKKIKLLCSFNGIFHRRPPSGTLRYTGGETRIISVDRNISFSRLKSKISELVFANPNNTEDRSFSLVYHLPESDYVVITSDDDVRCMIEEYEKVESEGKVSRVWIYVCNGNGNGNGYVNGLGLNGDLSVNKVDYENTCSGFRVMRKKSGLENRNLIKKPGTSDDSLRKIVLKQQLLAKQRGLVTTVEENEMECGNEQENHDHPLVDLTAESERFLSNETANTNIVGNSYGVNSFDYKYTNSHIVGSENFGNLVQLPVSHSHSLNPTDGNLESDRQSPLILGTGAGTSSGNSTQLISAVRLPKPFYNHKMNSMVSRSGKIPLLNNMNRENIMPWGLDCNTVRTGPLSSSCELVGSAYPMKSTYGSTQSGIRSHQFGLSETRNQRTSPCQIRNHRSNLNDMGYHRNARLDSRPWAGKFYPGLKSISNISKQKPWSASHHQKEGLARTTEGGLNSQIYSCSVPYEKLNPKECHLAYLGASTFMAEQYLLPQEAFKKSLPCTSALDTQIDLLTGPSSKQNEVLPSQTPYSNLEMLMNEQDYYIINEALNLMGQQEALEKPPPCTGAVDTQIGLLTGPMPEQHEVSNQTSYNNLEMPMIEQDSYDINGAPYLMDKHEVGNTTMLGCSGKFSDTEAGCKSFSNRQNGPCTVQGGIVSCVDLSLHNLSLSSSEHVEPPPPSPHIADFSAAVPKPQSKPFDVMDEEQFSSGPQVEKSSGDASPSSYRDEAKMEKDNDEKTEIEQDPQSGLSSNGKECIKKTNKYSKVNGVIPLEIAAFYTHLATRQLQTIKTSDLEYIKELGSGTYGTVFYGKWKGSDVAIKRIKPSCFTESAMEEDRLVADFWKEAHILGQLHHPNIVALYGVVTDGPVSNLATVTEYMVNGSLKQVLRRKDRTIDRRKRLIIAMDAAFGMEYLHEKNIVHFDLKSHNFLVNMRDPKRPVCKIGDLGLSKIKQKTLVSGGVRGTIPWMAPELLNSKNLVTEKVDVYSFGIVMWELLTGEEPYANMRSEEIIAGIIKGNLRPEIPNWCDPAWRSLMERCWSSDPAARPTFSEIAKELRTMAAAMNIK